MKRLSSYSLFLLLMALLFGGDLLAQKQNREQDFQIWSDVSASYKLNKKWKLDGEVGLRTRENSQLLKQYYLEFGGRYKINKRFNVVARYRFVSYYEFGKSAIHRINFDVIYDNKWKRFSYDIRLRYQQGWYLSNSKQEFYARVLRSKFELSYDIRKNKLEPYFSLEHYLGLNGDILGLTAQLRWTLGLEYPITKWSDLALAYRLEQEFYRNNPINAYILLISYKIDIN